MIVFLLKGSAEITFGYNQTVTSSDEVGTYRISLTYELRI
jgi:hypothetical protein